MSQAKATPSLKTARGLGSAKEGTDHWWMQRLSAIAMMVLSPLMILLVITLIGEDYATATAKIGSPFWGGDDDYRGARCLDRSGSDRRVFRSSPDAGLSPLELVRNHLYGHH